MVKYLGFSFFFFFFFSLFIEESSRNDENKFSKFERGNKMIMFDNAPILIGKIFLLIFNTFVTEVPLTIVNSIYEFNNWKRVNNWMRGRKREGNKGTRFVNMRVLHFTIYLNGHSNLSTRTSLSWRNIIIKIYLELFFIIQYIRYNSSCSSTCYYSVYHFFHFSKLSSHVYQILFTFRLN